MLDPIHQGLIGEENGCAILLMLQKPRRSPVDMVNLSHDLYTLFYTSQVVGLGISSINSRDPYNSSLQSQRNWVVMNPYEP